MGVIANIFSWRHCGLRGHGLASILAGSVLIALLYATSSIAETGEGDPGRSVETSPTDLAKRASVDAGLPAIISADDQPLTRAASKLRIDEISPTRWLSRFGRVSIGRRE